MKKLLLLALLVGLVGCSVEEPVEKKEETPVETKKEEPKKKEEKKVEPKEEEAELSPEIYLALLQENFEGIMEVTYDKETMSFHMLSTDPEFAAELALVLAGQVSKESWNSMVDSIAKLSGRMGPKYLVYLMNPVTPENYLLMVGNGTVLYDAMND